MVPRHRFTGNFSGAGPLKTMWRERTIESLRTTTFDVLVIGGGITGCGIARDAAMRGLRVALVEQDDFASGTSSRSSRLVHGGVRYLEHGQLSLVFESSRERRTLLRIAPHLVRPLSFTWPVYSGDRIARWKLNVGLALYDSLALFRNVGTHRRLTRRGVERREPELNTRDLVGGATYWDASTDDARLTLANAIAAREEGAAVLNHAKVTELHRRGGRVDGATVEDGPTGESFGVAARVVVNAAGPWSDSVESLAHAAAAGVRGSKGAHVIVPRVRIGNVSAITLTAPQDGRVMFVLPADAFTIIGTTDTFDAVSPAEARATRADVEYLLEAANHYFPHAQLQQSDVVAAWAGIRPLAAQRAMGSTPVSASREHAVDQAVPGLVRITGGKLTTYRAMASEAVDVVAAALGTHRAHCRTSVVPLPGGDVSDLDATMREATNDTGDAVVATRLVRAYGSRWRSVWALGEADSSLRSRITPERPYLLAELRYAVQDEMACSLGDLLIRRTPVAFETIDHGRSAARAVAASVATWLGADNSWRERAVSQYDAEAARMFAVD